MTLTLPSVEEERDVLSALCYADNPNPRVFQAFSHLYVSNTVCPDPRPDHAIQIAQPTFQSHKAVIEACVALRASPTKTRAELQNTLFADAEETERHRCLRIITRLALMVDCDSRNNFSISFKTQSDQAFPAKWRDEQTLVQFLNSVFPADTASPLPTSDIGKRLKAWKLQKRYNLRIVPTDDLAEHLFYNSTTRTLSVFRQIAYLKAHLRHSFDLDTATGTPASILHGSLPPQLLLETLYTIYYILFPLSNDPKSDKLARRLVKRSKLRPGQHEGFGPDLLDWDGLVDPLSELEDFKLVYWANQVRTLKKMVLNPPPTYNVVSWIERHTSERNALSVALIGVFLAVLFGLLGLLVGVAQLVVSILAWKYPTACV